MAIDATFKGQNSNSYVTKAEATAYIQDSLYDGPTWEAKEDYQEWALLQAARIMDLTILWKGDKVDENQAMQWPRYRVPATHDYESGRVGVLDWEELPTFIKVAQIEIALALVKSNLMASSDSANLQSVSVGEISLTFKSQSVVSTLVPQFVRDLISPYVRSFPGQNSGVVKLERA